MRLKKIIIAVESIIVGIMLVITAILINDISKARGTLQALRQSSSFLTDPSIQASGRSFIGIRFMDFILNDTRGNPYSLEEDKAQLKIIILFNTGDCAGCLAEYRFWKRIYDGYPPDKVSITGISNDTDIGALISFLSERDIRFRVLHDSGNTIRNGMGLRFSPLRIMLDRDDKILAIERTGADIVKQRQLLRFIDAQVSAPRGGVATF